MWVITIKDSDGTYEIELPTFEALGRFYRAKRRLKHNVVDVEYKK